MPTLPSPALRHWRVVTCPGAAHKGAFTGSDGRVGPKPPKILFLCNPLTQEVIIQCADHECRKSGRPTTNGWFLVKMRAGGSYTIQALPRQTFSLIPTPGVVFRDPTDQ